MIRYLVIISLIILSCQTHKQILDKNVIYVENKNYFRFVPYNLVLNDNVNNFLIKSKNISFTTITDSLLTVTIMDKGKRIR